MWLYRQWLTTVKSSRSNIISSLLLVALRDLVMPPVNAQI
jgi:hypothetical protein